MSKNKPNSIINLVDDSINNAKLPPPSKKAKTNSKNHGNNSTSVNISPEKEEKIPNNNQLGSVSVVTSSVTLKDIINKYKSDMVKNWSEYREKTEHLGSFMVLRFNNEEIKGIDRDILENNRKREQVSTSLKSCIDAGHHLVLLEKSSPTETNYEDMSPLDDYKECLETTLNLNNNDALRLQDMEKIITTLFKCNEHIRDIIKLPYSLARGGEQYFGLRPIPQSL
jgi:hypothetical protein